MGTNTFNHGQLKILVYKEKKNEVWYATALELNLTVDSHDRFLAMIELQQAIADYVQSAQEIGDTSLLNQEPDPELLALWQAGISSSPSVIESPYIPFSASVEKLGV